MRCSIAGTGLQGLDAGERSWLLVQPGGSTSSDRPRSVRGLDLPEIDDPVCEGILIPPLPEGGMCRVAWPSAIGGPASSGQAKSCVPRWPTRVVYRKDARLSDEDEAAEGLPDEPDTRPEDREDAERRFFKALDAYFRNRGVEEPDP
jgi:hypothetical protein